MKSFKALLILLSLYACVYVSAQNLSVESFRLLPNDLTANTYGTMERDQNGEVAALIKVVTLETGFVFDGGMLGIVKTVQKEGEIWVYVPFGLQRITITHRRFGVLRDYYFEIPIQKALTYEMKLSTGVVRTVIEDNSSAQFVTFNVNPANAIITIDNISYPLNADGSMRQLMASGTHSYRVDAPGYFPENGTFQVGGDELTMDVTLKSMHGTVRLECPMVDADLYLNNEFVGKGSWTGTLAPAMYQVEARHEGYRPSNVSFALQVQEDRVISIPQPQPIYGGLIMTSTPSGATVYIDGVKMGDTPLTQNGLLVGSHEIEFRKDEWNNYKTQVVVEENKAVPVNVSLENDFMATIQSVPSGAALSINGLSRGVTPAKVSLTPGNYEVKLSKTGWETFNKKVLINQKNAEQVFKLKERRIHSNHLYLAAFTQVADVKAIGGQVGVYVGGVNIELGYTKPLLEERTVYWVSATDATSRDTITSKYDFSSKSSVQLGYVIQISRYLWVTPQFGTAVSVINETETSYRKINMDQYGRTAVAPEVLHTTYLLDCIATVRMEFSPLNHVSLFVAPTYNIPWKQGNIAKQLSDYTSLIDEWHKKLSLRVGVDFYF